MARLNVAKAVLLDPALRAAYDTARRLRFTGGGGYSAGAVRPATTRSSSPAASTGASHTSSSSRGAAPRDGGPRSTAAGHHRRLDGPSLLLIALAAPAVIALALYLYGGIEAAGRPRSAMLFDLALSPSTGQDVEGTAQLIFALVGGKTADERTARYVLSVTQNLRGSSPEADELRALGRALVEAARRGDQQAWSATVARACVLAGHC